RFRPDLVGFLHSDTYVAIGVVSTIAIKKQP
ncbi:hypothetical protein PSYAC_01180, partial [Pseudomonas syringae pv. actinidiae str. M302091]